MCGKIEVMDETCSQTFPRKLEQNLNIFVPKIQVKTKNQMAVKSSTVIILKNLPFD